jgi:ketosteroid isomerase-like protein
MSDVKNIDRADLSPVTQRLFNSLDAGDIDGFIALLDENCTASFGNIGPVPGAGAVKGGLEQLFAVLNGMSHEVLNEWVTGPDTIVELRVTYNRKDGKTFVLPATTIWTVNAKGLISSYRIYIDQSPLNAP